MRRGARLFCAVLAIGVSLLVAGLVFRGHGSHALTLAWLLSLLPFALATSFRGPGGRPRLRSAALLLLVAALPVLVRVADMDRDRLHLDEYLTGYFSATHDFARTSFFGYMPERWEWQGQFPKPFFFLQRLFFDLFGKGPFTLHLSVQLYVAIVSVMLFLIVREMLDSKSALVAVLLYSFFAPSVYLETLGFMFVSSTAIFTVFFYFALREYRTGEMFHAAMAGIACGFCYLTYYSSYLALPMMVAFFTLQWLRERSVRVVQNFAIALGGVFIVVAPFAAAFLRAGDYVSRRSDEISLLHGAWSPYREVVAEGKVSPLAVLRDNLVLSLKSFFQDGIGGHGGYDFGHLAFFDRFSLVLFVAGVLAGLVLALRRSELLLVFLLIGAAFVSGMVMTIPPPAYHRFSIAFPFVVILMALPFSLLLRSPKPLTSVRCALAAGLLLVFAGVNQRRYSEAVFRDQSADDLRLVELLKHRYGGRNLYVAAFPAFGFDKVLYFRGGWKGRVETGFHDALLKKFNRRERYVYVMIFGSDFQKRFEQADPNGRFARFSTSYSLFAN